MRLLVSVIGVVLFAAGCGSAGGDSAGSGPITLRLGVFPNVTHAPGLVGIEKGIFEQALGKDVKLEVHHFNAGGEAAQALLAGAIDLTYIGPNPAINAFAKSKGEAVRLIGGSTSGGAFFVVREGIESADDLKGKTLASPQPIGNTQDVALRAWLDSQGLRTDADGGGDVAIKSLANADVLQAFQDGKLDGAWVPEPWATRLVQEGKGKVLVDERDLWPGGRYVTTHLLAGTEFLEQHPDQVRAFLQGHLDALKFIEGNEAEAQRLVGTAIDKATGKKLPEDLIAAAWKNIEFTADPIATALTQSAASAEKVGLLEPVDLNGIYDLTILNDLLRERQEKEVAAP